MSHQPERSGIGRRKDEFVTVTWLQGWIIRALWGAVGITILALGTIGTVAWRLSAQASNLDQQVKDAKAVIPQVIQLTEEVRLLRKGQDSLITLMTDREKRPYRSSNPLVGR